MFALIRNRTTVRILKSAFCRPALAGLAMVALIAVALFAGGGPALAHDPYRGGAAAQESGVDLSVYVGLLDPNEIADQLLFVANNGTTDAFGVRVEIEFGPDFYGYEAPDPDHPRRPFVPSAGSLTKNPDNPAVWIWEIPKLPAQSWHSVDIGIPYFDSSIYNPYNDFGGVAVVVVATVSSDSVEDETKLENNRVETWLYINSRQEESLLTPGPFSVETTVDNQIPQPGEEIVFEISAFFGNYTLSGATIPVHILSDTVVQVQLTPGLTYSEGSSSTLKINRVGNAEPKEDKSDYSHNRDDNTGRWGIGPFVPNSFHLELTATVDADAGGEEQCLTAEISGRPDEPLGENGGDRSLDNIARVCVQPRQPDAPAPAVLSDGEVSLFTWWDCVGQTDYPCDSANNANGDGLEVVVLPGTTASNTAAPEMLLQPKDLLVHVRDRRVIEDDNMVKSVVWSTGLDGLSIPGVQIGVNNHLMSTIWSDGQASFNLSGPGTLASTFFFGGVEYPWWNIPVNGSTADQATAVNLPAVAGVNFVPYRFEFSKLGTYVLQYSNSACYGAGVCGDADPSNDVIYTDTETYTFHVGPMADLAVHSVWETAQGVTVAVVNNGPDPSPGGQVMLNTGEICDFDHLHPHSEISTCTLAGAGLAGTDSIGTIEGNVKYGVCIDTRDGSNYVDHVHDGDEEEETHEEDCNLSFTVWRSGDMYDPYPGNNDVRGPADSAPIPGGANAQFASTTTSVTIRGHRVNWAPLDELYGWEVSHYEVERLGLTSNRWQPVTQVPAPPFYDTDEDRGSSPRYRVRAVNVAGQEGPWAETGVSSASSLPRLTLSLDPATIAEPDGQATVTARLNKASGQDVPITVSAELASGSDTEEQPSFTLSDNKQLMIPAGMLESTGAVTITANADDDGLNEQVRVSAVAAYVQAHIPAVTLTIQDDDAPGLKLIPMSVAVNEGATLNNAYTVELNAAPTGGDVVVSLTGSGDVTPSPRELTFTADNWDTARMVDVIAARDADAADDMAAITHRASGAAEYRGIQATATVVVTDDDNPGVTVSERMMDVTEGQGGKTYMVRLDTEPAGSVVITTSVTDNPDTGSTDVRVSPPSFTLNRNNWRDGYTVTVSAGHDSDSADDRATISHAIDGRTTASEYVGVNVDSVGVRVSDDDAPGVQVSPERLQIAEGRSGSYNVRLNTAPSANVTVSVSSSNPDVRTEPASLVFTAEDWNRGQRVTVHAGLDDDAADDRATLRHSVSQSGDGNYPQGLSGPTVAVTVSDPDRPGVTVGPLSPSVVYEAGRRVEDRNDREVPAGFGNERFPSFYTVRLDAKPTGNVVIEVKSDNTKVTVSPSKLTFTPSKLSHRVEVLAAADADKDDEKATITHTVIAARSANEYDGLRVASLDLTVDDNDDAGVTLIVSEPLVVSEDGGTTTTYWVVLDTRPDGTVGISIEPSNRDKVKVEPSWLYLSGGYHGRIWPDWDMPQKITVTVDEGVAGETVTLIHKIADINAADWDYALEDTEVGRLTVRVE